MNSSRLDASRLFQHGLLQYGPTPDHEQGSRKNGPQDPIRHMRRRVVAEHDAGQRPAASACHADQNTLLEAGDHAGQRDGVKAAYATSHHMRRLCSPGVMLVRGSSDLGTATRDTLLPAPLTRDKRGYRALRNSLAVQRSDRAAVLT